MERPLSQEYINITEEDRRFFTEVIDRALPGQVSALVQVSSSGLTMHDLQLRKVISSSSELRLGCYWTLWKAHLVKNKLICLRRIEYVLLR